MKLKVHGRRAAALAGTALVTTLGAAYPAADADHSQGFIAQELDGGYLLFAKADSEGKCGEGKCGESKSEAEGTCGDAGSDAKTSTEGKCGGVSDAEKESTEGKCGEGKCGGVA